MEENPRRVLLLKKLIAREICKAITAVIRRLAIHYVVVFQSKQQVIFHININMTRTTICKFRRSNSLFKKSEMHSWFGMSENGSSFNRKIPLVYWKYYSVSPSSASSVAIRKEICKKTMCIGCGVISYVWIWVLNYEYINEVPKYIFYFHSCTHLQETKQKTWTALWLSVWKIELKENMISVQFHENAWNQVPVSTISAFALRWDEGTSVRCLSNLNCEFSPTPQKNCSKLMEYK